MAVFISVNNLSWKLYSRAWLFPYWVKGEALPLFHHFGHQIVPAIFTPVRHERVILPTPLPVLREFVLHFFPFHKWQMVPHVSLYIFAISDLEYVFHMFVIFISFMNYLHIFLAGHILLNIKFNQNWWTFAYLQRISLFIKKLSYMWAHFILTACCLLILLSVALDRPVWVCFA